MKIEVFRTGDIEYPDMNLDKPVRFRKEDFDAIIKATEVANLTEEHTDKVLAQLSNFQVVDDKLFADLSEDLDLKGMGISPRFKFSTIDKGDYCVPCDIELIDAGITKNPRSQIYFNNIGDVNMGENTNLIKQIQENNEEIRSQREEIGTLKARNKKLEDSLKESKEIKKQLNEKTKELEELTQSTEILKSKADAYDKLEKSKKEAIIAELSSDDEQAKERFSKMSLDDLEFLKTQKVVTNKPTGVGENGANTDDGTQSTPNPNDEPATSEDYLNWKKQEGVR